MGKCRAFMLLCKTSYALKEAANRTWEDVAALKCHWLQRAMHNRGLLEIGGAGILPCGSLGMRTRLPPPASLCTSAPGSVASHSPVTEQHRDSQSAPRIGSAGAAQCQHQFRRMP